MANIVLDFLHNYQTGERRETEPANAYQYDEGHVLEAVLPEVITSAEIHYWIRGMEEADAYTPTSITPNEDNSCTVLGNIPNSYFETNGELRIYIVVTDGTASITTYEGKLHICQRSMPDDYVDDDPENEAVRVITEARAAAATATQKAGEAAESAEQAQEILDSIPEDYSQLSEDVSDLKDDFHSYHNELGAGYADQLVSGIQNEDSVPYNFRKVPYDATLEQVEGIVGCDVVVNQLCNGASVTVPNGHKYYMLKGGTASVGASTGTAITGLTSGTDMVFDLTQTFGTAIADYVYSLEQSTAGAGVAWLNANFPKIFDAGYIAYNAGTLVHVSGLSAKKTVGFNQWDEETHTGYWDVATGNRYTYSSELCSENPIRVIPNTTYYYRRGKSSSRGDVLFYASDGTYIGSKNGTGNNEFTTPENCAFIQINIGNDYGNVYHNDICINLSDPTKNGTYEPYEAHEYPLDSSIDLHGILKLDANNQLYADGDVYKPDGSVNRRYGVVDLGTLTYVRAEVSGNVFYQSTNLMGEIKPPVDNSTVANCICPLFTFVAWNSGVIGNGIGAVAGSYDTYPGKLSFQYTSASTVEEFKTAMSGVYLVYELATPTTETAEPYTETQICDPNGTEEYISTTVAPVGHVTRYPLDVAGRLDNILSMPTADGTYTLRATVNNGKVTYSWVSA